MKKHLIILGLFFLLAASLTITTSAEDIRVGDVYSSQILATVDGHPIPSYNIGGRTCVVIEDLAFYGFRVVWDPENGIISATSANLPTDYERYAATPRGKGGSIVGAVYETKIVARVNNLPVTSYNIGGYTCVCIEDLGELSGSPSAPYGFSKYYMNAQWDPEKGIINLGTFRVTPDSENILLKSGINYGCYYEDYAETGTITVVRDSDCVDFRGTITKVIPLYLRLQSGTTLDLVIAYASPFGVNVFPNFFELLEQFITTADVASNIPSITDSQQYSITSKLRDCIVKVYNYDIDKKTLLSQGTGFFIDRMGHFITNAHVIEGTYYSTIVTRFGLEYDVDEINVYNNTSSDYAICHADCIPRGYVEFSDTFQIGDPVLTIGYPDDALSPKSSTGQIVDFGSFSGTNYIVNSAPINYGNSGGVLVNSEGKVIGITTGKFEDGTFGAIPYSDFAKDIKRVYMGTEPIKFFHKITTIHVNSYNFTDYFDIFIEEEYSSFLPKVNYIITLVLNEKFDETKIYLDSKTSPRISMTIKTTYYYRDNNSGRDNNSTTSDTCYFYPKSETDLLYGFSSSASASLIMAIGNDLSSYKYELDWFVSPFDFQIID